MRTRTLLVTAIPAIALVGFLLGASGSGCDGRCSGNYNCPAGASVVDVPQDLTSPVASVTADPPCMITSLPSASDGRIYVAIDGERTGSCAIHATLVDGTELSATLAYTPLMCCGASSGAAVTLAPVAP